MFTYLDTVDEEDVGFDSTLGSETVDVEGIGSERDEDDDEAKEKSKSFNLS